jgi:hypothetical protein
MNNKAGEYGHTISLLKFRLIALVVILSAIALGIFTAYSIWEYILPLYGRIYRNAPIVETPYLAFCLLMAPPITVLTFIAACAAAWSGKKFDPPPKTFLNRFQELMIRLSIKILIYVVPAVAILTTLILLYRDYTPCPKLLISGSAWQLFWVNDKNACFKPTRYINDNWPCKMIGNQEVCIQVDGR